MKFLTSTYFKALSFEAYLSFGLSFVILLYAFSPFRMGANLVFQNQTGIIFVITALSWTGCICIIIKQICCHGFLKHVTSLDLLLFVYLIYLLLQLLFYTVDREYALRIACLVSLYYLFRNIPAKLTVALLYLLPVLAAIQIVYGYNRLTYPWQGLSDITGGFTNTGIFGGFVAMGCVAAFGLLLSTKRPYIKIAMAILLIPLALQLFCSQSRAGYVAAITGIFILLFSVFRKKIAAQQINTKKLFTRLIILFVTVFLLIAAVWLSVKLYHYKKDSADGRLLIWTVSCSMLKEKPLTGFGPQGFQKNYPIRQGLYLKNHPESNRSYLANDISSPFNELLKTGIEQGIVGLFFVFGMFYMVFDSRTNPPVLRATLAAIFAFSCFSYPFDFFVFQLLVVFCLSGIASSQKTENIKYYPLKNIALKTTVICLITVIYGTVLISSLNYYKNVKNWNRTTYYFPRKDNQKIDELKALYPAFKYNAQFLHTYGSSLYEAQYYNEAIAVLEEAKELFSSSETLLLLGEAYEKTGANEKALEVWETASHIKPSLFMPHYNMAKLYYKTGDYELAKQKAGEVLNKKIKINLPKINRIKKEMQEIYLCDY